ncbi:conserved hypothetical protein [Alkalispirochaeta americana]|uniref:Purine nucleoside phosphorylase n=1 Tax=Alkalispirochaeta americana TaxID=159291 RepID=A0A1N6WDY0_9SPIO|nr:polyphenol oxidase family protein [Alkalispirochaeta americana]SIQ88232.1 conserved hypothetical protein [Alkalispirochaeta americana]
MLQEESPWYVRFRHEELDLVTTTRKNGNMLYGATGSCLDTTAVAGNYRRLGEASGIALERMVRVLLEHGDKILEADGSSGGEGVLPDRQNLKGFDGLITGERGLYLGITTADCFPVVIQDRRKGLLGIVHCGWRGIALRLEAQLFRRMVALGCRPENMRVIYGPGICPDCYVQSDALLKRVFQDDLECPRAVIPRGGGYYGIDLQRASRENLRRAGFPGEILDAGICNSCDPRFFSVRREGSETGRMVTLAALWNGADPAPDPGERALPPWAE